MIDDCDNSVANLIQHPFLREGLGGLLIPVLSHRLAVDNVKRHQLYEVE